ncbi:hypothetical protein Pan153_44850 [Gimesia panareensis]|uniref:Tetratricopeptide repeat protein n=1 Tax=Gimesia panareensis TaxID=2527978 RepID=A0A518FTZ6_9PLAN|nr:hypothetical protein [Gimesia panareensis]QDV19816.1 hypothetical protein Pan153_44850 [Gimesia panareensis]
MPVYLLTATDQHGKRDTHRVNAESAQEACSDFEAKGYGDIVLHNDDAFAAAADLNPVKVEGEHAPTPAEMVQLLDQSNVGFFLFLLKKLYWQFRWGILALIGLLVLKWYINTPFSTLELILCSLYLVPVVLAVRGAYFSSARKYHQLMQAASWGRWQEVLDLAPRLRGVINDFELSVQEACALTGLGRLEAGLERIREYADSPDVPRWMYLGRLAELYGMVNDRKQFIECMKLACEDAPGNPAVQLDYAYALLKFQENLPLAQKLISEVEQQQLGEMLEALLPHMKGILALNQGHLREAEECFLSGVSQLSQKAASQPLTQYFVDLNRAYLAVTYAELGDFKAAEKFYQLAESRLKTLDNSLILERYQSALK